MCFLFFTLKKNWHFKRKADIVFVYQNQEKKDMIKTHTFIEWNACLIHGVKLIDNQHEKLVNLTNNLYIACCEGKETADQCFIETARETVKYVNYHFSTEEQMMLFLMYPHYQTHKKEHEKFIREILCQTQMFTEHKALVPNRFVQFLKDWVLSHIAVCDKALAEFVLNLKNRDKLEIIFSRSV